MERVATAVTEAALGGKSVLINYGFRDALDKWQQSGLLVACWIPSNDPDFPSRRVREGKLNSLQRHLLRTTYRDTVSDYRRRGLNEFVGEDCPLPRDGVRRSLSTRTC